MAATSSPTASPLSTPAPTASSSPTASSESTPAVASPDSTPSATASPDGTAASTGLRFDGTSDAGTLTVIPTPEGFEFGAILADSSAPSTYVFALDTGGLTAVLDDDGLGISLIDPTGILPYGQTGPVQAGHIDAPGFLDASGLGATNHDVDVAVVRPGDTTLPAGVSADAVKQLSKDEVLLVYSIDPAWLSAEGRAFPVSFDPVACVWNGGSVSGTTCTSGETDTYIGSSCHNCYPLSHNFDRAGIDSIVQGDSDWGRLYTLLKFSNPALGDGAQITSATITTHEYGNYNLYSPVLVAHRITTNWTTTATYDGMYNHWSHLPADTVELATCAGHVCDNTMDITSIVRQWYMPGDARQPNYGLAFELQGSNDKEIIWYYDAVGTVAYRPHLIINYVIPVVEMDFDASLGQMYSPSLMVAGRSTTLPVVLRNKGNAEADDWNASGDDHFELGYRWYDQKGKPLLATPGDLTSQYKGTTALPEDIANGHEQEVALRVTPPPSPGRYTLRLDLVHKSAGHDDLWSSDWVVKSNWMSRTKRILDPSNVRMTGSSPVERDEFNISVVPALGTSAGLTKTVGTGDGGTLGINLSTKNLSFSDDTGLGFQDLLPMSLTYGYNSDDAVNCTTAYQGILGACGWYTNWDERLTGAQNADYKTAVTAQPGLTGYWRLGETSGTTAGDVVAGGHSGSIGSAVVLNQTGVAAGDTDRSMKFVNATASTITVSGVTIDPGAYTIEAWVRPTALANNLGIAGRWNASGGAALYVDSNGYYALAHSGTSANDVHTMVKPAIGRWDFLVGTYDGTTARIYVNGLLAADSTPSSAAGTSTATFEIGDYNATCSTCHYQGSIDEVAVYSAALGGTTISSQYAAAIGGDPGTFTYESPSGARSPISTDGNGQLSGASVQLSRVRATFFDENPPLAGSTNVSLVTAASEFTNEPYSGSYVLKADDATKNSIPLGSQVAGDISLRAFPTAAFGVRSNSANAPRTGVGYYIFDKTTGQARWFIYGVGTDWTSGQIPTGATLYNLASDSISGVWYSVSDNLYDRVRNDASHNFGAATDDYYVRSVQLFEPSSNTGGSIYVDAWRLESSRISLLDETNKTWTSGGTGVTVTTDAMVGTYSIREPAVAVNSSPNCLWTNSCMLPSSAKINLVSYPFANFWWKKVGGTTAAVTFHITDTRSGAPCTSGCSLTYYAGIAPPAGAIASNARAIQISTTIPTSWSHVTRNVLEDARQMMGLYNDNADATPDPIDMTGFRFAGVDGNFILADDLSMGSIPDVGNTGRYGTAEAYGHPSSAGDSTFTFDFKADYSDGTTHYFNRDGLLTRITNLNGRSTKLNWNVTTNGGYQTALMLTAIHAASDGFSEVYGTYDRQFTVTRDASSVTFSEMLGTTSASTSDRKAVFYLTTNADSSIDLAQVSPARQSPTYTCDTHPSGCLELSYTDTTNHRLAYIADPRWDGSTSGANDYRFEITWDSGAATAIFDRSHSSAPLLKVLSWDDNDDSTKFMRRPLYQDASAAAAGYAIHVQLTPEGSTNLEYAAQACTNNDCSSSGNWPPGTSSALGNRKMSESNYDGLTRVSTVINYRCPGGGIEIGGCPASTNASITVTRRGTNAAEAADNYADALSGNEVAWTQSEDQYVASMKDSGNTNPDLYRTSYVYDGYHHAVDTVTPVPSVGSEYDSSDYQTILTNQDSLVAYYPMADASGTTMSGYNGVRNGSYIGSPTLAQAGPLLTQWNSEYNGSVLFSGSTQSPQQYAQVPSGTIGTVSGSYTVELWVKLDGGADMTRAQTFIGTRSAAGGFDAKFQSGKLIHADIGSSSAWLTTTADADLVYAIGRWYHIVYSVGGGNYTIFVDGSPIGGGSYSGTAVLTDGTHKLCIAASCNGEYFDGQIGSVSIFNKALTPSEIHTHYLAGMALAEEHSQPTYDRLGRQVASDDEFMDNNGFESGLRGWQTTTGVSANIVTSPTDPTVHYDANAPSPSYGSLKITANGATASQQITLVPGQTVRLQVWHKSSSTSTHAQIWVDYIDEWLFGYFGSITLDPVTGIGDYTDTSWTGAAWDITLPASRSDGHLIVNLGQEGAGTVYFDDLVVTTKWSQTRYETNASYASYGLPTDAITFSTLGAGGSHGTGLPTSTTHYDYGSSESRPALFATSKTENYVSGGDHTPDQNVVTSMSVDAWGRTVVTTDPDGRVGPHTYYLPNQTDVDYVEDVLGNKTSYTYDAVGNTTKTKTPEGHETISSYDLLNHVISSFDASGIETRSDYNGYGQLEDRISNYVDGSPSGSGTDDVKTTYLYDERGRVTQTDVDTGPGGLDARTASSYDMLGNVIDATTFAGYGGGSPRVTTNVFEKTAVTIGGVNYDLTRSRPTATRGPIDGLAPCPDGSGDHCNSVTTIDLAGRTATSIDALGNVSMTVYDVAGHAIQGNLAAASACGPVTRVRSILDLLGHPLTVMNFCTGLSTGTTYDALGRATLATSYYGANSGYASPENYLTAIADTVTRYLPSGKVDMTSSTEAPGTADSGRSWTKNVYDAAGRQTATLANYDITGNAQLQVTSFESGTDEGVSGSTNWAVSTASTVQAKLGDPTTEAANSGFGSLTLAPSATSGSGASLALSGTFKAGRTYAATVYAKGTGNGQSWRLTLGANGDSTVAPSGTAVSSSEFTAVTVTWQPTSDHASGVLLAITNTADPGTKAVVIDDIEVWDTGSPTMNIPSMSVFDKDGHAVVSVLPGGAAGDTPMVTRTAYDHVGRVTDVTVAAVAGAGTSASDKNLTTHSVYDALGRTTDVTDPAGHITRYDYNRLGQLTGTWLNYTARVEPTVDTADANVHSTFAYDAVGEMIGYCSAENRFKATQATSSCDPASPSNVYAWHFAYDAAGHKTDQTPPINIAAAALDATRWTFDEGGRVTSACDYPAGGQPCTNTGSQPNTRHTDTTYDALSHPLTVTVVDRSSGADDTAAQLVSTTTYNAFGSPASVTYEDYGTTATPDDSLTFTYDSVGRPDQVKRGGTVMTDYGYNPDGTVATRKDGSLATVSFGYDWAGRQITASGAGFTGTTTYTYRLDGLLNTVSLGNGETETFGYDLAHRPVLLTYGTAGSVGQEYDRAGNVTKDKRNLTGCSSADACTNDQSFSYDGLRRVIGSSGLDNRGTTTYTYDLDSNRLSKSYGGISWTYSYDRTDQLVSESSGGTPTAYAYNAYGDMTGKGENDLTATAYAYDLAGRLTAITPASGSAASFSIDALGRQRTRTIGTATDTYGYVGASKTAYEISTGASTTDSLIDSSGSRIATRTGSAIGWTMTDLHGNVVGDETGTKTIQDAFRFDAYGETVCAWPSGGSALNLKWRHQGRLDISPNSDPLYAANARFYAPSAGVFTQLDSVSGSAQNPLSMNRFLYALANPATFVDPSGHTVYNCVIVAGQFICTDVDDPGAGGGGWTSTPVTDKPKTPKTDDGGGGDDGDGDDGDGAQLPEGPCADNTHWCGNTPPVEPEDVTYHRQFLQQCMSVFADLARCIKAWHAATDDTKVDGYTDMLIQLVLTNMDLPTNVVGMEVWSYVFRQEVKTNMALGLGRADAINFARSAVEHKLGDRAAMWSMGRLAGLKGTAEMGTKALGRLGIFTDAAYVFSQCHESLATCGLEAGRTAGIDALALRIGAAVGTGCLEGLEGGPIGCALLGTGVGVLTGVGLDAVLPHFSDQPSFAETWEAACLVSIGASTANNWCRS